MAFYIAFMAKGEGNNAEMAKVAEASVFQGVEASRDADATDTRAGMSGRFNRFMTAVTVGLALASCAPESQKAERDPEEAAADAGNEAVRDLSSFGRVGFSADTVKRMVLFYGSTPEGAPAEVNIRISHDGGAPMEYAEEVAGTYARPIELAALGKVTEVVLSDDNGFRIRVPQDLIDDLNGNPNPAEWGTIPERP